MSFAYGFGLPHWQPLSGGAFSPAQLFQGGVQGAWYDPSDSTTLFSDRAGTTPCGTPGGGSVVPVGAMLDKRAAGYSVFFDGTGDNLETPNSAAFQFGTGDFTVEGWIYVTGALSGYRIIAQCAANSSWSTGWSFVILNDRLNLWLNGGNIALSGAGTILANTWQHVAVTRSGTTVTLWIGGISVATATNSDNLVPTRAVSIGAETSPFAHPFQGYISNVRIVKGTAVYTGAFTPSGPLSPIAGTSLLTCGTSWTGNPAITKNGDARVDGLNPFTASPVGNHAIAANDTTARPELRARVNFLTYSEDFGNAAWTKNALNPFGSGSVANTTATLDPIGGNTADFIQEDSTNAQHYVQINPVTTATGVVYAASVYVKPNGRNWIALQINSAAAALAWINIGSGVPDASRVGTQLLSPNSVTAQSVGNGWVRCTITKTAGSVGSTGITVFTATADNVTTYTGDGTSGIFIWGAQLTATNEFPANTYQRIVDANTYDAVGFPRYLVANGTSSAMSTPGNVNLSGTDKVTVFAGVRKLSDAAFGMVAEFGNNAPAGSFWVLNGDGAVGPGPQWQFLSIGATTRAYATATATSPISNVFTGIGDINAPLSRLRLNGAQVANTTTTQGGGNYGTYPLFIGARNNASLFFTGNIYSLIVVGSAVSAGQISATEQWVAGKTGITI